MADYHMLNDGVFGVAGGDILDDTANLVNAVSYSHAGAVNVAGQGMMSQSIPGASAQNPNVMMQGMVPMQQAQAGAQMSTGGMTSYHQGAMHGYAQSEVPQKLHQYSVYGSQLQAGNMGGQYVTGGPRLHHLSDTLASSLPEQQASPRTVVPNQMSYQNRNMPSGHYGQQLTHPNSASAQMTQGASQYQSHYSSIPHHSLQQQHTVQMNQSADMWQNSMPHTQMTRACMPASQTYSQHQMVPNQLGATSLNHNTLALQAQRPSTPNQGQYLANQEYAVQHASNQQPMQRPPAYNMNATPVNQNGTLVGQMTGATQSSLSQPHSSLSQTEQTMTFPQGHYVASSQTAANRPHYNTASAVGSTVGSHATQQHVMGQQLMGMRPSVHQMGYSQPSTRVNSGQQQHGASVPPGSPARLQQYHPPFSPSQTYSTAQPSPRPANPESATPPHLQHFANSQPHIQAPMSPQYRSPFPSQVTHSPQHLTPTPPAEVSVPPPHTPERGLQSSTPQSQGSYHSPSTVHLTSPVQGHSPGNSNAPSSLQHLEQMVLPRVSSGPSTTPTASSVSPAAPNQIINHNSGVGANYYGHLSNNQHTQQQQHMLLSPASDARPQPQSPVFAHVSQAHTHHAYLNQQQQPQQPQPVTQQPSPSVSSVPNSQPLLSTASSIQTLPSSNIISDEAPSLEPAQQQHSSISFNSDSSIHSSSTVQGANGIDSNLSSHTLTPSVNVVGSVPSSAPTIQAPCVPSVPVEPVPNPSHQYMLSKTPYQGNTPSVTYEMQQIQQELQQLYGMHQSPELHDKIKSLQERLRFLQGQQNASPNTTSSMPQIVNKTQMTPHYPRQTIYNSGKPSSYGHQPLIPHTVHYNPQAQQQPAMPDVSMPSSQQNQMMSSILPVGDNAVLGVTEQDPLETGNLNANHYSMQGNENMPPLTAMEGPEIAPDPYELNFSDEPPPKLKRRAPKGEPKPKKAAKSPKLPKSPKSPKPKKPKKAKNAAAAVGVIPPTLEPGLELNTGENMDPTVEGAPLPPTGELLPGIIPEDPLQKPPKKKGKKRKTKDSSEPGAEPKEPKPKKPRKRAPRPPKQPKAAPESAEPNNNDGNNNSIEVATEDNEAGVILTPEKVEGDAEGKENVDSSGKETKEKKSGKSKSPKTPKDGTPKEPKKSTPKKKLPKIALRFTSKKKKKKPLAVSENSDLEATPPPSPKDDATNKRRSARNTERKKYTDDIELHLSDDETIEMDFGQTLRNDGRIVQVVMDNHNEDYMVVEKILAVRNVKKQLDNNAGSDAENSTNEEMDVEEYYVKYKNLSYIHCEWKTTEELEKGDRRFAQKVKRFKLKKETFNFFDFLEEDPFNPDYIEVDRVLDVNEIKDPLPESKDTDGETSFEKETAPDEGEISEKKETPSLEDPPKLEEDGELKIKTEDNVESTSDATDATAVKDSIKQEDIDSVRATDTDLSKEKDTDSENVTDVDSGKAGDTDSVNATDIDSVKATDMDSVKATDMNSVKATDTDSVKATDTDSVKATSADVKADEYSFLGSDEDSEKMSNSQVSLNVIENESKDVKSESTDDKSIIKTEEGSCPEGLAADVKDETEKNCEDLTENVIDKEPCKITRHYLVKWRGLTYEESTWELEDDVDRDKIDQFERFRHPPPQEKWKNKKRPKPSEWDQLPESPVYKGGNTLREYQLEGLNWLTFCWHNSQNCILADEMGLGKTIQSLTYLNEIDKYGIPGPFLVIAPLSTIGNWQREFETWTDLNAITYHGSSPSRNMILEYEMYWKNEKGERILDVYKFQVMITTFEIILTDCMELKSIPWRSVIIDEAHRLKNRNCKLLEGLRMLNTEHRVLLTGTPLQNNVEELFSLLNFLEPSRFASTEAFLEEFGNLKTESQVDKLKALLKPMMLRRLKEDVEKSLAPKEETVVEVELTNMQKKYYRAILERNFTFLTKGNCYSNIPNLMNTMMELRKCCIHPFLINGAEEQIIHDFKLHHEEALDNNLNAMIQASGKLVLMDKLLPRLRTGGHRVLVFSQMVRCLDILEDYMVQKRYPYERIDGRVRGNLRQAAIDRFCKPDSDRFVFLLCTRAGGLGINLTAADTVIIFDSDWNPQNDLQAQARCHRIGQSKAVKVYRLICRNTYEREMFDKASLKLGLDKAVLQSMSMKENVGMNQQMSKKEIEDLLRKGAYGALMEDDNAGDKFCEEDIDQILQRRTQVIQLESGTKGSTFSKATFASASTRSDIEINDPNFWEKWAKKANLDVDELKNRNELIIQEPRRRTQTRRFGTDDLIDLSDLDSSDDDDESVSRRTRASRKNGQKVYCPKSRGRRDDEFLEDIAPGNWTRAECYKVEKGLLTFGWGRWDECIALGQFRRPLSHKDCEDISRTILLYCLLHYKGDEKIKSFIWDLISPTYDGEQRIHKNHSESETTIDQDVIFDGVSTDDKGLSAPVPRGRKGKKVKKETKLVNQMIEECEWTKEEKYNPEFLLNDDIYKRHLNRHANKVLLRVRLLYYLKHEIIGDLHNQVFSGAHANMIDLFVPLCEGDPPTPWWDQELDKSLLLGIYKLGFERYNLMRQDPSLCFLSRCGPPDGAALLAELNVISNEDDLEEHSSHKDGGDKDKDVDELEPLSPNSENDPPRSSLNVYQQMHSSENVPLIYDGPIQFPSVTDVNTRVRRLITAFQRNNKKLEIRNAQKARKIERREKFEAAIRERELKKRELQQRKWSRREEADFYRTISSFGVEFTEDKKDYNWARFRGIARLERKFDETLAEYYKCFFAMCKRVCGRKLSEEDEQLSLNVDAISEERASRCLQRVELLSKIREETLVHPELDERLKLCQPSMDLPDWWICGKHDKDLLIGAAKHGLSRMDYHLLHDPNLSFKDVLKNIPNVKSLPIGVPTPIGCSSPSNIYHGVEEVPKEESALYKIKDEPIENQSDDKTSVKMEVDEKSESVTKDDLDTEKETNNADKKETSESFEKEAKDTENDIPMEVDGEDQEKKPCDAEPIHNPKSDENIKEENTSVESSNVVEAEEKPEDLEELPTESESKVDAADIEPSGSKPEVPPEEKTESSPKVEIKEEEVDSVKNLETDEAKNEDEETDIELDLRKEEDDQKAVAASTCNTLEMDISKSMGPPILEEVEKDDQKYDCETDTESKSTVETPPIIEEAVSLKTESPKKELSDGNRSLLKIKQEDAICEDDLKEKGSVIKTISKDDTLHSHIDDSQGCISQNEDVMSQASFNLETELGEPTVAQLLAFTNGNAVRWPKDKVLQIRLEHIAQAVEKNEWPVIRHTFLPAFPPVVTTASTVPHVPVIASPVSQRASPVPSISSQGHSGEVTPQATPEHTPHREPLLPDIPTPTPSAEFNLLRKSPLQRLPIAAPTPSPVPVPPVSEPSKHRRRRRRRRFEIEAERGMFTAQGKRRGNSKLRQLLSHNIQQQQHHHQQQMQHVHQFLANTSLRSKMWDEHIEEKVQLPTVPSPAPAVPTASANIPPPAHQNSSPRLSASLPGTLDLRVKSSITPPTPFTPLSLPSKGKSPIETSGSTSGSPSSPMDLSASSVGTGNVPHSQSNVSPGYHSGHMGGASSQQSSSKSQGKTKEKRGARGGSRIDALALNLQARKQQQLMQEQHHPLAELGSLLAERSDKGGKELSESDEPSRHHMHHHSERRGMEEEEVVKMRKKRSSDDIRKALNRGSYDLTPATAHSSYMNPSISASTGRLSLGSMNMKSDDHSGVNNPMLDHSSLMHHDFKKWLDDHPELVAANPNLVAAAAAAMAFSPVSSFPSHTELLELPEGRRRGRRPRLDPTKLDYEKITGEENVSVINRVTGKKITGSKAPPLKYLAEWLDKNPMFDVDPKWGPLVREKGNLPNNMNKRIVTPSEKRGRRTAASLLASAHQSLVPPVTTMSFPSSPSLNPLSFANTGMLTGFPNMKFFMDPPKSNASSTTTSSATATTSTNPIFLPFGGLAGMGLTNPLFGFPGFNFPGLQGTSLGSANLPSTKDHGKDIEKSSRGDKDSGSSMSRKNLPSSSSATSASLSSTTTMPSASSLPFLYPPGLLYNPLGLGGFTLPPNLPASFGSFSQSSLVNGLGGLNSPLFTTSSLNTTPSSCVSSAAATMASSAAHSLLTSTPAVSSRLPSNTSSSKMMMQGSFSENQETDDESLKSLMGNHDDDDDDLDDGKTYDNLEKDDSDKDAFRDAAGRRSPVSHSTAQLSKNTASDSEGLPLAKTLSDKYSVEILSRSRGVQDDPTSDSTDTESKHS